jgi:hypothetical protein
MAIVNSIWLTVAFYAAVLLFFLYKRKSIRTDGFSYGKGKNKKTIPIIFLYKINFLKDHVEKFAKKHSTAGKRLGKIGIIVSGIFAILAVYLFLSIAINSISAPKQFATNPNNQLMVFIPGIGIPLIEGLIVFMVAMFTHEAFHAWVGVSNGFHIKEIGIGSLLFIPLAYCDFKEINDKMLKKNTLPKGFVSVILAGVFGNIILFGIFYPLYWLYPSTLLLLFWILNFLLALVNVYPLYITDGSWAMRALFSRFVGLEKREQIIRIVSLIAFLVYLTPIIIVLLLK